MAAKSGSQMSEGILCIHCLQVIVDKSEDHVFPSSWYPATTPETVQRWKAPSCKKCNNDLGKIEKELLIRLGLCINPRVAAAAGIPDKALRSLGVGGAGKSEREREFRAKTKTRIMREMIPYSEVKGKPGIFPGFGPHAGFKDEDQIAIKVPHDYLVAVAQKVARGCEFILADRYLRDPYGMRTYFVEPTPEIMAIFDGGEHAYLGPGFKVTRRPAADDPLIVLYRMFIWGTFAMQVAIDLESELKG